jgi:VanZ family protein
VAYAELAPFDFTWSSPSAAGVEWLPFASYYYAQPANALFDAGKKLLLGGVLGGSLRAAAVRAPTVWAAGLSILLEAIQLLEVSRHASLGDVLILTAGSAGGAVLFTRYRAMLDSA